MGPKNIATFSSSELKNFLDSFDTLLCDCDGTLWNQTVPIPEVTESISAFKKSGKKVCLITNASNSGVEGVYEHAKKLKFDVTQDDIIIPSLAMIAYLKKIHFQKKIFVLGSSVLKRNFEKAGFAVSNSEKEMLLTSFAELAGKATDDDLTVGAVVFDLDLNLTYVDLLRAITYLSRSDVLYLVGASDKMIRVAPDRIISGQFEFQNLVTKVTGKNALMFGKPSLHLNEYLKNLHFVEKARTIFVGDSLEQDMTFANMCEYRKVIVLTGMTTLEEAKKDESIEYYINSFGNFSQLMKDKLNILQETVEYVQGAISALQLHF